MAIQTNKVSISTVASADSSTAILAAKLARRGVTIHNASTAVLYLRFDGGTAAFTAGNFSVSIAAGAQYEVPFGYKGAITGIWAAANGYANITEFV